MQNCHPFHFRNVPLVLAHNGDLARFAEMKPLLAPHLKPEIAAQIHGTTDSEWVYALIVSQLPDPHRHPSADELAKAVERSLDIIRDARKKLGIAVSSSLNLFIADGTQLAAVRYCFDFGCFPTEDAARLHEANLSYLSPLVHRRPRLRPARRRMEDDRRLRQRDIHIGGVGAADARYRGVGGSAGVLDASRHDQEGAPGDHDPRSGLDR